MCHYFLSLTLIVLPSLVFGQLSSAQFKSLNNYVDYANQSAEEMTAVVQSVIEYYPRLFEKNAWNTPRYVCPVQLEEYYYNKMTSENAALGSMANPLLAAGNELKDAAEKIDTKCKALDTYHKLEDYKKDNYASAESMVRELQELIVEYNRKQSLLSAQLEKTISKSTVTQNSYTNAAALMRKELSREREFLNLWRFNLKEEIPTGWIVDELQKSISATDEAVKKLKGFKVSLSYPASSMWPSFIEDLGSILETKRRALDEYNFDARKSDKHQNDVYLSLINYYNGALLSNYNTFIGYAANDKFYGLKAIKYVPSYEINSEAKLAPVEVVPFKDSPFVAVQASPKTAPVTKQVFGALGNYVDFINETHRQISHHRDVILNLNSSASFYASLETFQGRGGMSFTHDDFELPLSQYQKTIVESEVIPENGTTLKTQAEVLLNILKEIDQLGAALEQEVKEKRYEKDGLGRVYKMIERTNTLFEIWDDRKEILFNNVWSVFSSYPVKDGATSWYKSGKTLRDLVALDHAGLFKAKNFYKGKSHGPVPTDQIDAKLREVIANEYENMKGIEKYGRSNGLCPYTPYEDLPQTSKQLSEYLAALKPAKPGANSYQHPYHSMAYAYNEIVDDYNKFCELSPVPHLKYIKQPELFGVIPPQAPKASSPSNGNNQVISASVPLQTPENNTQKTISENRSTTQSVKVIRDTVYIEKRDTVYVHDAPDNIRSMEGYAINNMVLLLDVSGSMNSPEKLPLLKKSVLDMLSMMRKEDEISIVVFSGKPKTLLPSTSFKDEEKIRNAINSLKPGGTTDGNAGLKLAYEVADDNYIRGGNNRIVLATDGEFAIYKDTEGLIEKFSREDIFLSVFYFGKGPGSARNLQRIAALGKGNYESISQQNVDMKLVSEAKAKKQR